MYFTDISISGNGTVSTIYSPELLTRLTPIESDSWPGKATNVVALAEPGPVGSGANVHYYLTDHLGTTQMEIAAGGWPTWQGRFTPFGQEVITGTTQTALGPEPADGTPMSHKLTGKQRDMESGLDYFGPRYYSAGIGRFTSPDPSSLVFADLSNPQSLNLYSYVSNNPLHFADPSGFYSCDPDTYSLSDDDSVTVTSGRCHFDASDFLQSTLTQPIQKQAVPQLNIQNSSVPSLLHIIGCSIAAPVLGMAKASRQQL